MMLRNLLGLAPKKVDKITLQDIEVVECKKTPYLGELGEPMNEVVVKRVVRDDFFATRPQTLNLLKRVPLNPLTEEGNLIGQPNHYYRDRRGEFFLTTEGLALWIQQQFFESDANLKKYNNHNIFVAKDLDDHLHDILSGLNLQNGEDAKIGYAQGIHHIAIYVRNEDGQLKAFVVDSQAGWNDMWPLKVIDTLAECLPGVITTLSGTELQGDTYTCTTSTALCLRYFASHGVEIFPFLESQKYDYVIADCAILPANQLMAQLMKINQNKTITPAPERLHDVASIKKGQTLEDYLQSHQVYSHNKTRNAAAILKKYKFFDQVDRCIKTHTTQRISSNPEKPLPAELNKICQQFQDPDFYKKRAALGERREMKRRKMT